MQRIIMIAAEMKNETWGDYIHQNLLCVVLFMRQMYLMRMGKQNKLNKVKYFFLQVFNVYFIDNLHWNIWVIISVLMFFNGNNPSGEKCYVINFVLQNEMEWMIHCKPWIWVHWKWTHHHERCYKNEKISYKILKWNITETA